MARTHGQPPFSDHYAGDITPRKAWEILKEKQDAQLVDVRTTAEWQFTGYPDLSSLGKKPVMLSWRVYPTMEINHGFVTALGDHIKDKDTPLLFLCRSGGRSQEAAMAIAGKGYSQCFNIVGGFEGEIDTAHHRGAVTGWKVEHLPWEQN